MRESNTEQAPPPPASEHRPGERALRGYLAAGALLLLVGASASILAPEANQGPTARGAAGVRNPTPVAQRPAAVAELLRSVSRYSRDCVASPPVPSFRYPALADAIAFVACIPTGVGANGLNGVRFAQRESMTRYFDEFIKGIPYSAGPCDASRGITQWRDRGNRLRGRILCGIYTDGEQDVPYVVWTDGHTRTTFSATGVSLRDLTEWWSKAIRPQTSFPTSHETRLLKAVSARVDPDTCSRDSSGGSPLSVASVTCHAARRPDGRRIPVDALFFEGFASREDLSKHFEGVVKTYAPGADEDQQEFCDSVSTLRRVWFDGHENRGLLLCWAGDGTQSIAWTDERKLLFGQLRRDDGSVRRTHEAWIDVGYVSQR